MGGVTGQIIDLQIYVEQTRCNTQNDICEYILEFVNYQRKKMVSAAVILAVATFARLFVVLKLC